MPGRRSWSGPMAAGAAWTTRRRMAWTAPTTTRTMAPRTPTTARMRTTPSAPAAPPPHPTRARVGALGRVRAALLLLCAAAPPVAVCGSAACDAACSTHSIVLTHDRPAALSAGVLLLLAGASLLYLQAYPKWKPLLPSTHLPPEEALQAPVASPRPTGTLPVCPWPTIFAGADLAMENGTALPPLPPRATRY